MVEQLAAAKLEAYTTESVPRNEAYIDFPVLVRVTGPLQSSRPGLDLVVVVDAAGNQGGLNLRAIKNALTLAVNNLQPNDRLAVIKNDIDGPKPLAPLTKMDDQKHKELSRMIKNLRIGEGGASVSDALDEAVKILKDREDGDNNNCLGCIIYLSDGGDDNDNDRKQDEFPVHVFGLSKDHNPRILKGIADNNSGIYSTIDKVSDLKYAIKLFIERLMSVTAMRMKIKVRAHGGALISSVKCGSHPSVLDRRSCSVGFGNIHAGEEKNFIILLRVPQGTEERQKLMTVGGQYEDSNKKIIPLNPCHVFLRRPLQGTPAPAGSRKRKCLPTEDEGTSSSVLLPAARSWTGPYPDEVLAELTRIHAVEVVNRLLTAEEVNDRRALKNLQGDIEKNKGNLSSSGQSSLLSVLEEDLREMRKRRDKKDRNRYMYSWLSYHQRQREMSQGSTASGESGSVPNTMPQKRKLDEMRKDDSPSSSGTKRPSSRRKLNYS